ncbi:related to tetracycline resistance protein (probable transport protein) [Cephalotrichum gorgonifer]|uniref:Related to tetracycline resistance protein (Probable transport protein) n=1 Tax=Cephalotrichum gorgonifer TaxID=2041049 RepID=A0AAE8MUI1_9PEZI|nr:related to tetracycline resistance protein (probable transport protein) [Cephalotrichum gorgonifer]
MVRPTITTALSSTRTRSSSSFHAGAPLPASFFDSHSRRTSYHYQTFPTPPLASTPRSSHDASSSPGPQQPPADESPLPLRQLLLLALLSFAEQTALNSISPYLPSMILSFREVPPPQVGLYVGILASSFALAQLSTNFFWGYLSDRRGRKPVLVLGAALLTACFLLFGFCRTYWQALLVHIMMGLLNGNAAVVPSAMGDLTDRSNQSTAFTWLPIIYSLGGLSGPALGGLLVGVLGSRFPFAASNIVVAAILAVSAVVLGIWFEETHVDREPSCGTDVDMVRKCLGLSPRESTDAANEPLIPPHKPHSPTVLDESTDQGRSDGAPHISRTSPTASLVDSPTASAPASTAPSISALSPPQPVREILNSSTIILLATYLIYQLTNISFNCLYPIFAAAPSPTGRDLDPGAIGTSLSVAGLCTIAFQAFLFRPIKARFGNLGLYRFALLGMAASMVAMPLVGHLDDAPPFEVGTGRAWLYAELGVVLVVKNISSINNSASSDKTLGTLNGIAQTISAAGRSVGPFLSGGLFTLSSGVRPKGELLAWGLFGGIAIVGYFGTLAVDGGGLESDDWSGGEESGEDRDEERSGQEEV